MAIRADLLSELARRRDRAEARASDPTKLAERHAQGRMTARERLAALFTPHTFQEYGLHVRHTGTAFGMADKELPGDGVVTGTGFVDGRPVATYCQDFMVAGGSLGRMHAKKICDILDHAGRAGNPVVGFNDSGGARIQEGVDSLSGYGQVFNRNVLLSGVVPQIAVICGPCAGGAAYSPALMDFLIMTRRGASMFICGPQVIKAATGQDTTTAEVGGPDMHASVAGTVHFLADDDDHAIQLARALLSYLPSNNMADPPHQIDAALSLADDPGVEALIPESSNMAFDVRHMIARLVDNGSFLEVHAGFAANLVVGFARWEGVVVGIIANQPMVKAGVLDIDASDKGARFIRFCNAFNIPLVTLVDVPGFLPGIQQERMGIIRHGAKMLFAYGASTVPKITVIMRKAYGGAYLAMCSADMGADLVLAWPGAEIAVMGAEGAINVLHRDALDEAGEARAARAGELAAAYRAEFASPYLSAGKLFVHDIIEPRRTRAAVALGLRTFLSKRESRPPKKHGNIPL